MVTSLGTTLYAAPSTLASFAACGQGIMMLTKAPTFCFLYMDLGTTNGTVRKHFKTV
jgi:hypothetical protein